MTLRATSHTAVLVQTHLFSIRRIWANLPSQQEKKNLEVTEDTTTSWSKPASYGTGSLTEHGLTLPYTALSGLTHWFGAVPADSSCASSGFTSARQLPHLLRSLYHFTEQSSTRRNKADTTGKKKQTDSKGKNRSLWVCYLLFSDVGWWILVCLWLLWERCACHWQRACQTDRWWGAGAAAAMLDMPRFNLLALLGWG